MINIGYTNANITNEFRADKQRWAGIMAPQLTEERLRTWIVSQVDSERMCLGILALDSRFSNVKPRRPKGGPDGGRDIEAVFDNRETVWGGGV